MGGGGALLLSFSGYMAREVPGVLATAPPRWLTCPESKMTCCMWYATAPRVVRAQFCWGPRFNLVVLRRAVSRQQQQRGCVNCWWLWRVVLWFHRGAHTTSRQGETIGSSRIFYPASFFARKPRIRNKSSSRRASRSLLLLTRKLECVWCSNGGWRPSKRARARNHERLRLSSPSVSARA
ncbi:unnamed protein product, partial [Ectocarpus sp. 6 AP-2014]